MKSGEIGLNTCYDCYHLRSLKAKKLQAVRNGLDHMREGGAFNMADPLDFLRGVSSWEGYVEALRKADKYWWAQSPYLFPGRRFSVLGEKQSWVETIIRGREIAHREDWVSLTADEKNVLLGRPTNAGSWDLLGNMAIAIGAAAKFYQNRENCCAKIREAIQPVISAKEEGQSFFPFARRTFGQIEGIRDFGPAIASRLMTLASPGRCISLNQGSVRGLSELTGLKRQVDLGSYLYILDWLYRQPWYQAGEPQDDGQSGALSRAIAADGSCEPDQLDIWLMRAALIDCFVYVRVST